MDIFEYAMKMEKDGEAYYRQLAEQGGGGLSAVFTMLADEEVKHYNAIKAVQAGDSQMRETTILDDAKNVFEQMKESGESLDSDGAQAEAYRRAQELEKKSQEFYTDKAGEVDQEAGRQLLLRLAGEEKKHYFLLENIIEFVSRPQTWLENAEFCHLDEY